MPLYTNTGLLTYYVDLNHLKQVLGQHPKLKTLIKNFSPKYKTKKSFLKSYNEFITYKKTLNLVPYGFKAELGIQDAFGVRQVYYKSNIEFLWVDLFESIHLGLL